MTQMEAKERAMQKAQVQNEQELHAVKRKLDWWEQRDDQRGRRNKCDLRRKETGWRWTLGKS